MIKKLFHITMGGCILAGLIILLGLTDRQNQQHTGNGLQVYVDKDCGNSFLESEIMKDFIHSKIGDADSTIDGQVSLMKLRHLVEGNPFVKRTAIYRTINGDVRVDIIQRDPLIRVSNQNGQGYYIDRDGVTFPLSNRFTTRVMIASGHIQTSHNQSIDLRENKPEDQIGPGERRLRDLFQLASYIDHDPFWRSLIDQVYVTQAGQFELVPMNGAHIIEFGGIEQMEEKFNKLMFFYREGLSRVGWNHYSRINVKFNNQVVCSK